MLNIPRESFGYSRWPKILSHTWDRSQGQDRKMNYKEKGLILKRIEKYRSEGA